MSPARASSAWSPFEGQIGEGHHAAVAGVAPETGGQGHGGGRGPAATGPGHRDQPARATARRGWRAVDSVIVVSGPPTIDGVLGERGQQGAAIEVGRQQGRGTEADPVASAATVVDDEHRAPGGEGLVDEVAVEARRWRRRPAAPRTCGPMPAASWPPRPTCT